MVVLSFLQLRRAAPAILIVLWLLGIGYLAAWAQGDEASNVRHPAVVASAVLVVVLMVFAWETMLLSPTNDGFARLVWTLGLVTLLIHVALAFWLAHGWSHEAAVEHVREVGGFGAGIIANYLFALIWSVDAIWWWVSPDSRTNRKRWIDWLIHGYLGFILLNATIVFGPEDRRLVYGATFLVAGMVVVVCRFGILKR